MKKLSKWGDQHIAVNLRCRLLQIKLRKSAIKYLFSNKMLTEKTDKRIKTVLANLTKCLMFEMSHKVKTSIDRFEKLTKISDGLNGYLKGNEVGFKIYEDYQTEELLRELVAKK